jgi:hypothetical protein
MGYTSAKETASPANPTTVCMFMCNCVSVNHIRLSGIDVALHHC